MDIKQQIKYMMKNLVQLPLVMAFLLCSSNLLIAQCPTDEESSNWGFGAVSMFYANPYYEDRRIEMGVSSAQNQVDTDNILLLDDAERCNQLQNHISNSADIPENRKNQENVLLVDENSQRYFIVFYTTPAQPGLTTVVYILDFDLNRLGAFGV